MTTTDRVGFSGESATLDPVSTTIDTAQHRGYLGLWRGVPRELGFLLLTLPIATVGYAVAIGLFSAGIGTLVPFFIGIFLLIGLLYVSRGFGTLELVRLEWAGRPAIARPDWRPGKGFWPWMRSTLGK